jgi:hypothetical protein
MSSYEITSQVTCIQLGRRLGSGAHRRTSLSLCSVTVAGRNSAKVFVASQSQDEPRGIRRGKMALEQVVFWECLCPG